MKRILSGTIALLCVLTAATGARAEQAAPAAASVITLQEAINTALANNTSIAIAQERYVRSKAVKKETMASGLPQITALASTQWMGPPVTFAGTGTEAGTITVVNSNSTMAQVALTQVLDINGRVSLATDIAGLNSRIRNLDLVKTAQQVIFDVQGAYYGVLRAEAQRDVVQAAVDADREKLKIAQAHYEAGTLPKFDMTTAEVAVSNDEQLLINATNRVDVQKAALRNVMGTDPTLPIDVVRTNIVAQPLGVSVEDSVNIAMAGSPDVQSAETNILLFKKTVTFAKREAWPTMAANAVYNYNANPTTFQPSRSTWEIAVNASVPIFTGGAISARVDQARSDVAIADASLNQTKLDVAEDVKTSMLNLNESYQRIQNSEKNVVQAEEALRLAQVRYQAGISLQVEVSDAQTALTRARASQVDAKYDYAMALAMYQRVTATQPEFKTAAAVAVCPIHSATKGK